jgi:iron complex outermembrane receptor protein
MIDGRTIYSPLFAGVFWGDQDVMLDDVDRIEVVSGPGAALWGANAVNGVINVRTKGARDTQGSFVTVGGGEGLRSFASVRHGGEISPKAHYRVYGKFAYRDGNIPLTGADAENDWRRTQGGFRVDWDATESNRLTFQGDLYESRTPGANADSTSRGQNLVGRWSRVLSGDSELQLQMYYDRARRNLPGSYNDRLDTYDFDFQHRFAFGPQHRIAWGAGYQRVEDDFKAGRIILLPQRQSLERFSAYLQDSMTLIPNRLEATLGARVEENDYTGSELQPSVRFSWRQNDRQTCWAALSRAVRTPSRLDRDRFFPGSSAGSPNFESEVLVAWELGGRVQAHERLSFNLATFYHDYDGIRSFERAGPNAPLPFELGNGQMGRSYGVEMTADFQVAGWWQLHAGLTELRVRIEPEPASADTSYGILEAVDSRRYASLRSIWNLSGNWELSTHLRHASRITNRAARVPGYVELDARIAWRPVPRWEISIAGRNLLDQQHPEYGDPAVQLEVERSVYGMLQWSF